MSNNVGPVCHIPPANTQGDPSPSSIPGIPGPANPHDPIAMANLVNALRLTLLSLLNQLNKGNNTGTTSTTVKPQPNATWKEQSRVTSTVRVFQNNDKSSQNWVDVEQINQLTMVNGQGQTWKWNRS